MALRGLTIWIVLRVIGQHTRFGSRHHRWAKCLKSQDGALCENNRKYSILFLIYGIQIPKFFQRIQNNSNQKRVVTKRFARLFVIQGGGGA